MTSMLCHSVVVVIVLAIVDHVSKWLRSCREAIAHSNTAFPKALVTCSGCCRHACKPAGVTLGAIRTSFHVCRGGCGTTQTAGAGDVEANLEDANGGKEFVVVEFNAWECAGLEILWAVVTTKIFDAVEAHPAFGRGAVRAARIKKLLKDPSWNWCGLATFYFTVALVGILVVVVLNVNGDMDDINQAFKQFQWALATVLVPGSLTLLNILVQMRSRGSLRTAQSALRKAISKKESVGEAYRGFMSDVKEELETLFHMINIYNRAVRRKSRQRKTNNKEVKETNKREIKTLALAVIVDDLDRCPKEKIMEMLKATHLLLEQPHAPMAVFLAVDPQLIVAAIAESLDGVSNTMKALQYLDKIVHLPFCIPTLPAEKKLDFLDSLLHGSDNTCPKTLKRVRAFLKQRPSESDLKESAKVIDHWCLDLDALLDSAALELVCTLHWWSLGASRFQTHLVNALSSLSDGLAEDLNAPSEVRRVACFKLLEGLCKAVNALMSAQAGNPTTGGPEESAPSRRTPNYRRPQGSSGTASRGGALPPQPGPSDGGENDDNVSSSDEGNGGMSPENNPTVPGQVPDDIPSSRPGSTSGSQSEEIPSVVPPSGTSPQTFSRAVSKDENEMFVELFRVAHATPRKIKRVVNVYFLQRSVAESKGWWKEDSATREKELVTWTTLAEFWPFRLSCIAFAMTNDSLAGKPGKAAYAPESSLADVYGDPAGDPSRSVCKWIRNYRGSGTPKDLYLSDDTEGRFKLALEAGAQITKETVTKLLPNSFNLNPAMMSTIEVEMVYD